MPHIDLLLPLHLDAPADNPDRQDTALRQLFDQPPFAEMASPRGVWQPRRADQWVATMAPARTTGGAYAESSRDLQRGLEVIEWHDAPWSEAPTVRDTRR